MVEVRFRNVGVVLVIFNRLKGVCDGLGDRRLRGVRVLYGIAFVGDREWRRLVEVLGFSFLFC